METKIEGMKVPYEVRVSEEASRPRIDHKLGNFTVVLPEEAEENSEDLLVKKKDWVLKKRKEFLRFKRKIPDRNLEEGGKISLLGDKKEITIEKRRSNKVSDKVYLAEHLVNRTSLEDQLEKLLREECRRIVEERVEKYSDQVSEEYDRVFIRDQETRWGSCSSRGNLNFNWRLILGPEHVLEYVVVHELVHLEEQNHNEKFWSRVREIYPNYKKSNRWLSENSSKLVFSKEKLDAFSS
ncbi:MAG: M48 family metallopeptidase [Nanohaloarchaea archaeon]|nr:M48 family metallopeptidase [Candidatus Nanohaloarchaea archaeon]